MRNGKLLVIIGVCVVILSAGAAWYVFRPRSDAGAVLGASTTHVGAFWKNTGALVSYGATNQRTIGLWSANDTVQPIEGLDAMQIEATAVSSDTSFVVVAERRGDSTLLWQYTAGAPRMLLTSFSGIVDHMQVGSTQKMVALLQHPEGGTQTELDVVDLTTGSLTRVAPIAVSFVWLEQPQAFVFQDVSGTVWYSSLSLSGAFDPPMQLIAGALSNPVAASGQSRSIIVVVQQQDHPALMTMDLVTKTQSVIVPLADALSATSRATLLLDPTAQYVLYGVPVADDTVNMQYAVLTLSNGTSRAISAYGHAPRWFDADTILYERTVETQTSAWRYTLSANQTTQLTAAEHIQLIP